MKSVIKVRYSVRSVDKSRNMADNSWRYLTKTTINIDISTDYDWLIRIKSAKFTTNLSIIGEFNTFRSRRQIVNRPKNNGPNIKYRQQLSTSDNIVNSRQNSRLHITPPRIRSGLFVLGLGIYYWSLLCQGLVILIWITRKPTKKILTGSRDTYPYHQNINSV